MAAVATGSFTIDLTWQASGGTTAGYRLERCRGAACGNFTQIAAPTGTSFTDAGLDAATNYNYQVRSADSGGNTSTPSNVASATTASAPPPPIGTLPAWVSALPPGQWFKIPNTSMSSVEPSPPVAGTTGPQSKVIAWTSFVVDIRDSKVYSVANGGHNDYSGNEVDMLDLELASPVWTQVLAPTPTAQETNCQSYYSDDRPVSRHSYYGATLNEINDRIMIFGGAFWCQNGGFHTAISSYNIGAKTYSPSSTHGSYSSNFAGVAGMSRDPATGDVYMARGFNFGRWSRSSNSFTTLTPSGSAPAGDEAMSAMDTTRGRILFIGGLGSDHHYYTLSSNSFTAVTLTGTSASSVSGAGGSAMVYVPALDRFLIRLGGAGGTVYQVHPTTFDVSQFVTAGGSTIPSTQNGPYNKFVYVPRLGGVVYVPSYDFEVWFLRTN